MHNYFIEYNWQQLCYNKKKLQLNAIHRHWCNLQVKLCDPCLSTLSVRYYKNPLTYLLQLRAGIYANL